MSNTSNFLSGEIYPLHKRLKFENLLILKKKDNEK